MTAQNKSIRTNLVNNSNLDNNNNDNNNNNNNNKEGIHKVSI